MTRQLSNPFVDPDLKTQQSISILEELRYLVDQFAKPRRFVCLRRIRRLGLVVLSAALDTMRGNNSHRRRLAYRALACIKHPAIFQNRLVVPTWV